MCSHRFFVCKHCGNLVGMIFSSGIPLVCCGENMKELIPNTVDASLEKHVPVVTEEDGKIIVKIGSVLHPMTEDHYIQWIYIETKNGGQRKCLSPSDAPEAEFTLTNDKAVAVYAYCNLHGLWKTEI